MNGFDKIFIITAAKILLVWGVFSWACGYYRVKYNIKDYSARIKTYQSDSARAHNLLLKCNGVISRENDDTIWVFKKKR